MDDKERQELILKLSAMCAEYSDCADCPMHELCSRDRTWSDYTDEELLKAKKAFSDVGNSAEIASEAAETFGEAIPDTEPHKTEAPQILDSGNRTEYSTGAVRDCKEGKGRCDLMPIYEAAELLQTTCGAECCLYALHNFKTSGDTNWLQSSVLIFQKERGWKNSAEMLLEVAKHFEEGAKKHGPNNWQKGIPVHSYIDSAVRHYLKYRAGWTDENHDRAFVWNLMCCIWTMKHHPELDDFTDKKEAAENE